MTEPSYTPPTVWTWNKESGGRFAAINRPIAGPTHDKDLPVGFPGRQWSDPRVILLNGQLLFQQGQAIGPEFGH